MRAPRGYRGGHDLSDILRDRELLVWVDNVPALSAALHGYSHAPEMVSLSNALHLLLAGPATRAYRPSPGSCTSLGRRTPLTFLVGCPLCVEMGPMLWTQIDLRLLIRVSWQRFARATCQWSSPLLRSWGT